MKRPVTLVVAAILQWIVALFALFSGLDLIAAAFSIGRTGVAARIEETLRAEGITDIAGGLVVAGIFLAGVTVTALALLRGVVAAYVWQGRSWARIVLTVLVVLDIIIGVAYLFEGHWLRMLLAVPVDIAVLWLMFVDQSGAYIREMTAKRRAEAAAEA